MSDGLHRRGANWYFRYLDANGRPHEKSTGTESYEAATRIRAEWLGSRIDFSKPGGFAARSFAALTSVERGYLAELKVKELATLKGWIVSVPAIPCRYDCILDNQCGSLYRAQIKFSCQLTNGVLAVGLTKYDRRYTDDEIDVVLVYAPQLDYILWVGRSDFHNKACLQFRLTERTATQRQHSGEAKMIGPYIWGAVTSAVDLAGTHQEVPQAAFPESNRAPRTKGAAPTFALGDAAPTSEEAQ